MSNIRIYIRIWITKKNKKKKKKEKIRLKPCQLSSTLSFKHPLPFLKIEPEPGGVDTDQWPRYPNQPQKHQHPPLPLSSILLQSTQFQPHFSILKSNRRSHFFYKKKKENCVEFFISLTFEKFQFQFYSNRCHLLYLFSSALHRFVNSISISLLISQ